MMWWTTLGVLTDLGWSMVGLAVGYILGLLTRITMSGSKPHDKARRILGVVMMAAAVTAAAQIYLAQHRLTAQAECKAAYSARFQQALVVRLEATEDERQAQHRLLLHVLANENSRSAIRAYIETLTRLDEVRHDNPLPKPPNCAPWRA